MATVTVALNRASSATVTLTVSAGGAGFTLSSARTLTIVAGSTASAGAVTVTAVSDTTDSPDKSVAVSAMASGGGVANPSVVTLTIIDDDDAPSVTLELADSSISENGGATLVSATLSHPSSAATTVTVTGASGFYTVGLDATIVIAAGSTANASDTATINAVNDAIDNVGNRTVTVTATAANDQGAGDVAGATLTLTDDEGAPTATLKLSSSSILESGGVATVTAALNRASSAAVTLTVVAAAGTGAVSGDFMLSSAKTLTIGAGSTASAGVVTVTANGNDVDSPDKSVSVSATASGGGGVADPAAVTFTIADDETLPTVSLVLSSSSISENGGVATVTAQLSGKSSAAVTVTVSASPGSGTDFTQTGTTLTIAAESTTSTGAVTVRGDDDGTAEGSEQITVSGTAAGGNGVADPSSLRLTLTDDDTPQTTLVLSSTSIAEAGGETTVTATLDRPSSVAVTITVTASPGSGTDFALSAANTLTFAANATTSAGVVTVTGVDDDTDAPNKSATVSGAASDGLGLANDPPDVTLTITDDDAAPRVTLVLSSSSISENGGVSTVTATMDRPSSQPTTVTVAASPGSGTDFTLSGTTLTVAAGATASAGAVTITAADNRKDEPDKDVTVSGTSANGHGKTDPADVTLTITDDDGSVSPPFALTADAGEDEVVDEGAAVTLSGSAPGWDPAGGAPAWAWEQTGGTPAVALTGAATAGPSFTAPEVSGVTVLTFRLTVTAGGASASDTVDITVVDRSGSAVSDTTVSDGAPDSAPTFGDAAVPDQSWVQNAAIAPFVLPTATGGDGPLTYTLSPAPPDGVARDEATRTVSGASTVAMDETAYTWTATDADGDAATLTFNVTVVEDTVPSFGDETITDRHWVAGLRIETFALPAATGGNGPLTYTLSPAPPDGVALDAATRTVSGASTVAMDETAYTWTATDADGDAASLTFAIEVWPRIDFSLADADAEEGDEVVFVLKLSPPPPRDMTVRFAAEPGTATVGKDYTTTPAARGQGLSSSASTSGGGAIAYATGHDFRIASGQTSVRISVRTINDETDEPHETFTLGVVSVRPGGARAAATGTILDNDHQGRTRAFEAVLAAFGRTVASEAVSVLGERFTETASGNRVTLGGHAAPLGAAPAAGAPADEDGLSAADANAAPWRSDADAESAGSGMSLRELAARSSFALSLGQQDAAAADADGRPTLWGRAGASRFSGRPDDDLKTEGEVFTGFVGADARPRPDLLLGVAVAHSRGEMDYTLAEGQGDVDATLTSVFPYGHWTPTPGVNLWAMMGTGQGAAKVVDEEGSARADIEMRMAALGGRKELGAAGDVDWALKGDGVAVRMKSDATRGLSAADAGTQRLRLLVEGSADWGLTEHARLRPRLEFGGRWDGGRLDKGFGQELGGGATYADARLGLEAEARGRYLLAHRSSGFEEWSAGLEVLFDPGGDGLGPWVGVSPQWGAADSGARSLWESAPPDDGGADSPGGRLGLEAGYRFDESRAMSLTFGRDGQGGGRSYGLGGRFAPDTPRNLFIEAEAGRRESETSAPEHSIGLRLRMGW